MALAQPTGLMVQALEPLVAVSQSVERDVAAGTLITVNQVVDDTATLAPGGELVGITQLVDDSAVIRPEAELIGLLQLVDDDATLRPAATLVALDQTVANYSDQVAQTLITLAQDVERHTAAQALVRVRQIVNAATGPQPRTLIILDGDDITAQCSHAVEITASEGDNRTATVIYYPPSGAINITSYQGKPLTISRLINDAWTPLFTGTVDVPRYDREQRTLRLQCSDLRGERLGRESQARLKSLTGGLYSTITQREDATGEAWVRELMKTVEGSLDYTSAGSLRYRPWTVGTPRYTLTADDIHHREISLELATRSEIVNRITGTLEYRYFKRNTFEHAIDLEMRRVEQDVGGTIGVLPDLRDTVPTKGALRSALNVSGWHVFDYDYKPLPADGWYKRSASDINPTSFRVSPVFRELRAMGIDATLERYISQPKREVYELTMTAPESIDQFGEIDGGDMRFSEETNVDPAVFEERGCVIIADADDRRDEVELALECMQRMGAKQIREGHRQNYALMRYKPPQGDLLPLEIGDTVAASDDEITCTGFVTEFRHVTTRTGDHYTDIRLAISRVDSAANVTEDWTLPAPPASYKLSPTAQVTTTPDCPLPADEVAVDGESRIEPDGTVYVITPSIGRGQVDEIIGTRKATYPVEIPRNQFEVEVP